ncbi:MAG TPA: translocation/assembly module TamB domain-containing protein [Bacteroidia bacterium]|jgi:hypothetical protein|nr:translocation/assembly module TamB domain-containing protein [Bacteroidia bacterium]
MRLLRKITRILVKTLKYAFVLLILLCVFVVIAINSESCQTWLAHKYASYLSSELGTRVEIDKLKIQFVKSVDLEGVFIEGTKHDTLLYSKLIKVKLDNFNYSKQTLKISEVRLSDTKANIIKYKDQNDFNFQQLVNYFSSGDTTNKKSNSTWKITYGKLVFNNIDFAYRNEKNDITISENMNYNNIHVSNVSGEVSNIKVIDKKIFAKVTGLKCKEQCGVVLEDLTGDIKISSAQLACMDFNLKTANSIVKGGFSFNYNEWGDFNDFIDKVKIIGVLTEETKLNFKDLAYFVRELNGLDKEIYFNGDIAGYVNDLTGENINLLFANNTSFRGKIKMKGLPDINKTYISFTCDNLSTSKRDLEKIPSYPFSEKKHLEIPANIGYLGVINFKGKFDGYINDFKSFGTFRTALGNLHTDLEVKIDTVKNIVRYDGRLESDNFNVGKMFGVAKLGAVALNSNIKGKGLTLKDVDAELDGKINHINYNNYVYQNINIKGDIKKKIFNGNLVIKDVNADLDFDGKIDLNNKIPDIDFISTINKLNLKRLGFINTKSEGVLSTQLLITLKGDNIDNISGNINFDNTIYKTEEKENKISNLDIVLEQTTAAKNIKLTSNMFNLAVDGVFKISNLGSAFNQFLNTYYPAFFNKNPRKTIYTDALKFKLTVKKFNTIRDLFVNDLMVSAGSVFEGDFDASKNLFNINSKSDSIKYKDIKFHNNKIESYSQNNKINLVLKSETIDLTDSIKLYNFFSYFVSKDNNTKYNFEWDNKAKPQNAGKLAGKIFFDTKQAILTYDKIFITAKDSTWNLVSSDSTIIDSSGVVIVKPLHFTDGNQFLNIYGGLSRKPDEKLVFEVANFKLKQLAPLLGNSLKVDGVLNGTFSLHNTFSNMAFSSNLFFTGLKLNNQNIGDGELKSEYNSEDKYLYLDGYTSLGLPDLTGEKMKNIVFSGYYYLNKTEESLDLTLDAQPANLTILNPYLEGIMTLNNGLVTGNAKVTGTPAKPKINGKFKIIKCELKVDYLNVVYNLNGDIEILPDQISFQGIKMSDDPAKKGFPGEINGNIFHNNFKNMQIDFDINFKNMLILNKTNNGNDPFYGKAYATGQAGIYGFLNNIAIEIKKLKTEKGTVFTIPLDGPAQVAENNFIHFVVKDTTKKKVVEQKSGFTLDMQVQATPDAEVQIVLDAKSGDIIRARGNGNIDLDISNMGKFDMFGEYAITSGDYLFTLENFITKKFVIQKGSTIDWSGNPYAAEINITANYKQRASIAPLFPYDTSGTYKRRLPVDCKLIMRDKLMSPNISFAIDLPTIDQNTSAKIQSIFNDETELNRQVFSLLLLKSFVTPLQYSGSGGISAGSAIAANGTEMLSNRLSGWLNGLTKKVDVGVNYRPGNAVSSEELDIALSKQLLNNRLMVDGNFGVNNNQSTNQSGLIGDVNVEYKLTDDGRYRVKGFNRSNDNTQVTTSGGPFTQGVGVFYREEYETWLELYKRYISKLKKTPKKIETTVEDTPNKTETTVEEMPK